MNEAVLARPGPARWATWLSNPTVFLCLVGVVLPNALSIGSLIAGIGVPPRPTMVAVYATLAILARITKPAVTIVLYVVGVTYDLISTVALLVNLAPKDIVVAVHLMAELNLFKSPLYVAMTIASLSMVAINLYLLTSKRELLRRGNPLVMMTIAASFGIVDFVLHTSPHYHYGALYATGQPMASAADASGFRQAVLALGQQAAPAAAGQTPAAIPPRHVLVVVVEALGQFRDPAKAALTVSPLETPAVLERYRLEKGTTTYYGSTTSAEMRELCDTRDSYTTLLAGKQHTCLPAQMEARGYDTIAMHGFTGRMFDRTAWYPKIGFQQSIFGEDILKASPRLCGGPFRGPCDAELTPLIEQRLRGANKPTFFYWLTLSTHAPVMPREGTARLACDARGGAIGNAEVCYMTEMWMDVFDRLAEMLPRLPPTEVLIVGDHAPPLWWRDARDLFEPGKVPWFRLTPRTDAPQAATAR